MLFIIYLFEYMFMVFVYTLIALAPWRGLARTGAKVGLGPHLQRVRDGGLGVRRDAAGPLLAYID